MKFNITESEKNTIREMYGLITENVTVGGRTATINSDGTVSIFDINKRPQKVRMSLTALGIDTGINVINIQPVKGGYYITGKSGREEFVDDDKIKQVIQFVDTNSPSLIKGGTLNPDLKLSKVYT